MMKQDRVCFPRVRSPQENEVRILHLLIRTRCPARSENRRQTGDARRVSSTVAAVYIVAAHYGAHELLRDVVQLVRRFRTAEHPERLRPVFLHLLANPRGQQIQRLVPACRAVAVSFSNQRRCEPASKVLWHCRSLCTNESMLAGNPCPDNRTIASAKLFPANGV